MMKRVERFVAGLCRILDHAAAMLLFAIMLLVVANILMRVIFNHPIGGTFELVCYGSLVMAAISLAGCENADGNITVPIIVEKLSFKGKRILSIITNGIGSIGFAIVTWKMVEYAMKKQRLGDITGDLKIPLSIFVYVVAVGLATLTLSLVLKTVKGIASSPNDLEA